VLTGGTKYLRHALVSSELLLLELGYVQFDLGGAELIVKVITERDKRASIAIATNLPSAHVRGSMREAAPKNSRVQVGSRSR
jgi:DNA replication protein DnaC